MSYYHTCPVCGANLDPEEKCSPEDHEDVVLNVPNNLKLPLDHLNKIFGPMNNQNFLSKRMNIPDPAHYEKRYSLTSYIRKGAVGDPEVRDLYSEGLCKTIGCRYDGTEVTRHTLSKICELTYDGIGQRWMVRLDESMVQELPIGYYVTKAVNSPSQKIFIWEPEQFNRIFTELKGDANG